MGFPGTWNKPPSKPGIALYFLSQNKNNNPPKKKHTYNSPAPFGRCAELASASRARRSWPMACARRPSASGKFARHLDRKTGGTGETAEKWTEKRGKQKQSGKKMVKRKGGEEGGKAKKANQICEAEKNQGTGMAPDMVSTLELTSPRETPLQSDSV